MLNKINSSIKNIHKKTIGATLALSLATGVLVQNILDHKIEDIVMDLQPATNSYLNEKFNDLRNNLRELQKNGLTNQETKNIETKVNEYKQLEDKIDTLNDSISFDLIFDSDEENEFSELLMHKIIDNFDINNTDDNINTVMKNFISLLNEIYQGKHDQSRSPINQGDIENTQNFIYQQNGEIKIDGIDIAFNIDNDRNAVKFMIESYNFEKEYSFEKNTKYNNVSFDQIDIQENISVIKHKPSSKSEQLAGNSFFDSLKNGKYNPEKKFDSRILEDTKSIINGHEIKHDNGVDFIKVKSGDSKNKIRLFLSNTSEYSYLKYKKYNNRRDEGFNIKWDELDVNMSLPIPVDYEKKVLSEEDFIYYAYEGLNDMKNHPKYGKKIEELLKVMTEKEILSLATAVAMQESDLGNKALHRYEDRKNIFSQGYYHLLMDKFGKDILDKLGLTEGSLSNPKHSTKAFLAFVIDKYGSRNLSKSFPLDTTDKINTFAKKYNGGSWLEENPHYIKNVTKYTKQIDEILGNDNQTLYAHISPNANITQNSSKAEIRDVQTKLQLMGYFPHNIKPNGVFGPQTRKAIKSFKRTSV